MDKLSNRDIVLYALYVLGGWEGRVHTEDIALKCFELAPSRFSWVKYPQYPDLSPTRFALEKAKAKEHGRLVKGESERSAKSIGGWRLTPEGVQWMRAHRVRIEKSLREDSPTGERLPSDRKLSELLRSVAFRKFTDMGAEADVSHAEFAESLVCTVNTRQEVLNDRLEQLYSIAEELGREDVKDYVDFSRKRFSSIL